MQQNSEDDRFRDLLRRYKLVQSVVEGLMQRLRDEESYGFPQIADAFESALEVMEVSAANQLAILEENPGVNTGLDARYPSGGYSEAGLEVMGAGAAESLSALAEVDDLDAKIEAHYRRIDTLAEAKKVSGDIELDNEIAETLAQLKALQKLEAACFREALEARLAMPVDAGEKILGRARALREKLGGPRLLLAPEAR